MRPDAPLWPEDGLPPYCFVFPDSEPAEPALREHLRHLRELRPGLQLHSNDACEAQDLTAQTEIDAGLRIVVLLDGALDVSYGARRLDLRPGAGAARALLVNVAEAECFTRRARSGVYSRRVNVGLSRDWLAQAGGACGCSGALDGFLQHHLALAAWQPSARALALAEQIVRPPPLAPLLQHLYLESRTLELVAEALSSLAPCDGGALAGAGQCSSTLRPREHQRLRELHAFICAGGADELSLDAIARHAGVNANTLQRQFKTLFGTTVVEFVRDCRMQRARRALEHDGITVGQAAQVAGYSSAANFATAYRRRFGHTPKQARVRV